ncbi:hypothetical protein K1T71_011709 [Dendrolimus kikuchii]|uniref:Uncharacterized protein n=1 Tax=Dendrolimus kikuchii TaxID=765133 RepID=A0ACC1CM43_9NEOP|nr:hypothetical protein K1T71_011709 [Dendrolimus kikuchii]
MGLSDFSPKDAYLKVRSLKSTYAQEIKKIKKTSNSVSSDGISNVYSPKVRWFYILHKALLAVNAAEDYGELTCSFETIYPEAEQTEYLENEDEVQTTNEENIDSKLDESKPKLFRKRPKKLLLIKEQRSLKDCHNLLTKVQNVANSMSKHQEQHEHEFDIFGKSIAAQLKNMPLDTAIEAQMFMQNYLSELRLRTLQTTMYNERSSSSHSNYNIS